MKRPSPTEIGAVRPGVWPATTGRPQQIFRPDRRRGAAPGSRAKTPQAGEENPGLPLKTTMTTREKGKFGVFWCTLVYSGVLCRSGRRSSQHSCTIPSSSRRPFSCGSDISWFLLGLAPRSRFRGKNSLFGHEKSRNVTFGHLCPLHPTLWRGFAWFAGTQVCRPAEASLPGPSGPPPSCVQRMSSSLGGHQTEGGSRRQGASPKMTNRENSLFGHEMSRNVTFGHLCPPAAHPLVLFRMFRGHQLLTT